MSGVIVGVLIMGIAQNVANLLNIPAFHQYLVLGSILLIAVTLDNIRSAAAGRNEGIAHRHWPRLAVVNCYGAVVFGG